MTYNNQKSSTQGREALGGRYMSCDLANNRLNATTRIGSPTKRAISTAWSVAPKMILAPAKIASKIQQANSERAKNLLLPSKRSSLRASTRRCVMVTSTNK